MPHEAEAFQYPHSIIGARIPNTPAAADDDVGRAAQRVFGLQFTAVDPVPEMGTEPGLKKPSEILRCTAESVPAFISELF